MQYQNVYFPDTISFRCKGCGSCCKDQPPDINLKEEQRITQAGYKNFMQNPANPNNRNLKRKTDGSCIFFTKENTCQINPIKPSICTLEPFIITSFDFRTNKIFLSLNAAANKTCKGISCGDDYRLEEIGRAAQTIIGDLIEIVAQKTGLSVTDEKVAFYVSKLLEKY